MSICYKRLIKEFSNIIIKNNIENLIYKIRTIPGPGPHMHIKIDTDTNIFYKVEITFNYMKKNHIINIHYDKFYPFKPPSKIEIDNVNIFDEYNIIMKDNNDLFGKDCICCKSLVCSNNWVVNSNINNILDEIIKVINYKQLKIKRNLLDKIINKYTNQNLDYLHYYLV
jgi:hypothetical protein